MCYWNMGNSFQKQPAVIIVIMLGIINVYHNGVSLNLNGELMMVSPWWQAACCALYMDIVNAFVQSCSELGPWNPKIMWADGFSKLSNYVGDSLAGL